MAADPQQEQFITARKKVHDALVAASDEPWQPIKHSAALANADYWVVIDGATWFITMRRSSKEPEMKAKR